VEQPTVRILVVVAIRLVRGQSAEVRKGFMRIVISHELVGFKCHSSFVQRRAQPAPQSGTKKKRVNIRVPKQESTMPSGLVNIGGDTHTHIEP